MIRKEKEAQHEHEDDGDGKKAGSTFFKKSQSYFFNCVDRNNHFKTRAMSGAAAGPGCNRYKPKYLLIHHPPRGFKMEKMPIQPSVIEQLILRRYRNSLRNFRWMDHK